MELPRRMIKLLSGPNDLVLDCFIGSGTSAEAAIQQGRKYLGFKLVPQYVAQAQRRCIQAQLDEDQPSQDDRPPVASHRPPTSAE